MLFKFFLSNAFRLLMMRFLNYLIGDLTICSTISCPIFIWNAVLKWMMCVVWLCLLSNCFSFILIEIMCFSGWLCYEQMRRFVFLSYFVSSLCVCVCVSLVHLYFTNLSYKLVPSDYTLKHICRQHSGLLIILGFPLFVGVQNYL